MIIRFFKVNRLFLVCLQNVKCGYNNILSFCEVMTSRECPAALLNDAMKQTTHLFIDCSLQSRFPSAFCIYTSPILTILGVAGIRNYSESRPLSNNSWFQPNIILKTEKYTTNLSSKIQCVNFGKCKVFVQVCLT